MSPPRAAPAGWSEVWELGPVPGWPLLPPGHGRDGALAGHSRVNEDSIIVNYYFDDFYPGWRRAPTSSMSTQFLRLPRMRRELVLSKSILWFKCINQICIILYFHGWRLKSLCITGLKLCRLLRSHFDTPNTLPVSLNIKIQHWLLYSRYYMANTSCVGQST